MVKSYLFIKFIYYKYVSSLFSFMDASENTSDIEITTPPFKMSMQKEFLKMSFSLILLLAFLFITVWLFKKFLKSKGNIFSKSSLIKILDKKSLTQKSSLYIVKIANKFLIIAESPSGIQYLSELPADTNFQSLLNETKNNDSKPSKSRDLILRSLKKLKGSSLNSS